MNLKEPKTFEEQVKSFISHNIVVDDIDYAVEVLKRINYYRLTGYALQFRKSPDRSDCEGGIKFELIYKLYCFDEELRSLYRKYLEIIEIYYRTQISNIFSLTRCIKPPYDQHYDENNFYYKKGYKEVIDNFKREKNYHKDSLIVKHHASKYKNKMPLWVITELISFSNLSKLYSSMYYSDKDAIAQSVDSNRDMLQNHLHCLSVLRNKCAHGARLYNTKFNPPVRLGTKYLKKHSYIKNDSLFAYTLMMINRLPNIKNVEKFINEIDCLLNKYKDIIDISLIGFPDNYKGLLEQQAWK